MALSAQYPFFTACAVVAIVSLGSPPCGLARELDPLRTTYEGRVRFFGDRSQSQAIAEYNYRTDYIRWDNQELALIFGKSGADATEAIHTVMGQLPRYYVRPVKDAYVAHFGNHTGVFRATHFPGDPTRYLRETMDLLDGTVTEAGYTVTPPQPQPEGGWVREIQMEGNLQRREHVFLDDAGQIREIFQSFRVGGGSSAFRGVSARLSTAYKAGQSVPETAVWEYFPVTRDNRIVDRPKPGAIVSRRHEYQLLDHRKPHPGEGLEMLKQLSGMQEVAYKTIHAETAQIGDKLGKIGLDPRLVESAEAVARNNRRAQAQAIRGARVSHGWWPWILGGLGGTLIIAAGILYLRKR